MSGIDIEGTLSVHTYVTFGYCAGCAWTPPDQADTAEPYPDQHRAHVAAVLREHLEGALAEARFMGKADAMAEVLDPQGPIWNRMHGDGWDERDRARATYPDPHPDDCMGWEDCDCATYPNPYRAAHLSDTERAGGAG